MKKISILLSIFIFMCSFVNVQALETDYNREEIKEIYNVQELSRENNVDPEELTDAIIHDLDSDRFSPFSRISTLDEDNSEDSIMPLYEFTYTNQDSTAYLATGNAGASGKMPWIGSCAVHNGGNGNTTPIIPFGTTILYMNSSVTIQGKTYSSFIVNDTGDPQRRKSTYWTDIYFGDNNSANYTAAINYGNKKVTIYFIR